MKSTTEFTFGSLINLITLAVGLTVGFLLGNLPHKSVRAQAVSTPSPQIIEVAPTMMVGSLGTNLALIHEVNADKVIVNGIDLLQFDQNVLAYLSRRPGAENADFDNLVNASRAKVLHRITEPKIPTPTPPVQEKK